jgi:hypothetical protein
LRGGLLASDVLKQKLKLAYLKTKMEENGREVY